MAKRISAADWIAEREEALREKLLDMYRDMLDVSWAEEAEAFEASLVAAFNGPADALSDLLAAPETRRKACWFAALAMRGGLPPAPYCALLAGNVLLDLALDPAAAQKLWPRKRGQRGPAKQSWDRKAAEVRAVMAARGWGDDEQTERLRGGESTRERAAKKHGMSTRTLDRRIARLKKPAK